MGRSLTVEEKELKKIVGRRIKWYREQRRISQAKLATMIGKGRDYWDNGGAGGFIRKVEKEGTLDVTLLKTIGDALGIPLFSFFDCFNALEKSSAEVSILPISTLDIALKQ